MFKEKYSEHTGLLHFCFQKTFIYSLNGQKRYAVLCHKYSMDCVISRRSFSLPPHDESLRIIHRLSICNPSSQRHLCSYIKIKFSQEKKMLCVLLFLTVSFLLVSLNTCTQELLQVNKRKQVWSDK